MHDRIKAIENFRRRVGGQLLIEGWVEGPCAEAADLRGINTLMIDFRDEPSFVRDLLAFCLEMATQFARAQLQAGADLIGIGDAAASLVGPAIYDQFVWPYERQLVQAIHGMGGKTRLHICGNTTAILTAMGRLGCDIVDLDAPAAVDAARRAMGPKQVLLGNIDPVRTLRNQTPAHIAAAIASCHRQAGAAFIVGAGCEVPRDTACENLHALLEYARAHGPNDFDLSG
jgi:MtaA/CmuA family methyltransferase